MRLLASAALILAGATPQTIWKAVTGFYGTRAVTIADICQARYRSDRFALVQVRIAGRRHIAALHLLNAKTGWVVMWSDGKVNRKIGPSTRRLVVAEVTRLKAQCLAP
ncbi:MAG TPA: hypothetical protein VIM05_00890 [Gaiellaceae bacterium]